MGKVSLISGIGELLGKLICAFIPIPKYANIGRNLSYPLGWMIGALGLLTAYAVLKKRFISAFVRMWSFLIKIFEQVVKKWYC